MGIPFIIGASQQKRKGWTLGFEPYVAPVGFDRTAQPVDVFEVFRSYYSTNQTAKYIFSVNDIVATSVITDGTSYKYGYTNGGIDYAVDLYNNTQTTQSYAGYTTTIKVNSTTGFPATGTLYIGTGSVFIYTSIADGTTFAGASQLLVQTSDSQVYCSKYTITWNGTKRWVIVNHVGTTSSTCTLTSVGAVWLYCGNKINSIYSLNNSTLTYIHIDNIDNITSYPSSAHRGCNLTGVVNLSKNPVVTELGYQIFQGLTKLTGTLIIPDNITKIAGIGGAFNGCSGLLAVTFPNTLTFLGKDVFKNCSSLTSLTIPNNVTSIDSECFYGCSNVTSLTLSTSLTLIGSSAFYNCSKITSLTIPDSVITIGSSAFYNCSKITSLTIPDSVTTVGDCAFYGCSGMTGTLTIPSGITSIGEGVFALTGFNAFDVSANAKFELGDSNTIMYDVLPAGTVKVIHGLKGTGGVVTLRADTTRIGAYSFYKNTSRSGALTIPNTVLTIGSNAFADDTQFTSLIFSGTPIITTIDSSSFSGCSGMTGTLTIPDSVINIGNSAFYGCTGFTGTLTIPDSVINIGNSAFYGCTGFTGLILETITSSLTNIGSAAFRLCSGFIGALILPNSITSLSSNLIFGSCTGFTSLTLPSNITNIGQQCFLFCSGFANVNLTLPNSLTAMGGQAFDGCSGLTGTLTFPNKITTIPSYGFRNCSGLTGLSIPSNITTIMDNAFQGCTSLTGTLSLPSTITSIKTLAFSNNAWTRVNSYRSTAPTITGIPFDNDAMELHIPTGGGTGYGVAPWTTATIFTQPAIADL